jgi:hypothetical protein
MAYPVPSHGSPCDVLRCFPMTCRGCGRQVVYYECSDGSRVLFDPPDRGKHICLGPPRPSRINRKTGAIKSQQVCGFCGQTMTTSRWLVHVHKHFG